DVRLNVSALSQGSYVIRINGEQTSLVRKFIKE
ncbi:MAG: T9SS type A sorting domain-containing protein, partial [Bernardetiaceae bacterium]|nr:T9SS type A sorting domain-containing protein [Bernardetiaceae bacterium]